VKNLFESWNRSTKRKGTARCHVKRTQFPAICSTKRAVKLVSESTDAITYSAPSGAMKAESATANSLPSAFRESRSIPCAQKSQPYGKLYGQSSFEGTNDRELGRLWV